MENTNWTSAQIDELADTLINKIAVVTGANSGIGKETAKVLAGKKAIVILAVRDLDKGKSAVQDILEEFPNASVKLMQLDLSSLKSIKDFAEAFKANYQQLNLLINNAGVMAPPFAHTEDGFELQMGTNHFGHFALTGLLLPILKNTKGARIVSISSIAHLSGNIDFTDLNWEKRKYSARQAYADSKIANLYFTFELSRKLANTDIRVVAAHPGWTMTNLQVNSAFFKMLNPILAQKPEMGALPTLRAAIDPEVRTGEYYGPKGPRGIKGYPVKVSPTKNAQNLDIAAKLWQISEELTGIRY